MHTFISNTSFLRKSQSAVVLLTATSLAALILTGCGDHDHDHGSADHDHADHGHDHGPGGHDHGDYGDHADHGHDHGTGGHDHGDHDDHGAEQVVAVTHYTGESELFMEHPPLVRGESARLIVHLTRMADFSPITVGSLEVRLTSSSGQSYSVTDDSPARTGIFLPEITPPFAGEVVMELILESPQMKTVHRFEDVPVYASADVVPHLPHEDESPDAISFLKEQQWRIDFATAPATTDAISAAVRATGKLRLPATGRAIVPAPVDGILRFATSDAPIEMGMQVEKNAELFTIVPDMAWGAGLASLHQEYHLARLELERVEALFAEEAVAQRRVEEARIKLNTLAGALAKLGIDGGAASMEDFSASARAPMIGVLAEIYVQPGQRVQAGDPLALVEDASRLVLEAVLPVSRLGDFSEAVDAVFRLDPGSPSFRISELGGAPISTTAIPTEQSGFARFIFNFDNTKIALIPGSHVTVNLLGEAGATSIVIPVEAVNEDLGQALVYVHVAGETVERRFPRLGASDGRHVAVLSGVAAGERVVTRGATAIRLSSLNTTEMGHGHAH